MRPILAVYLWELLQGLSNRFLQVCALACLAGGTALLAAAPGRDVLPMLLIQAILFFGSLFALLIGWGSGQPARAHGAFLFAQPVSSAELIVGQLLGAGTWCLLLLLLLMGPAGFSAGMVQTLLALGLLGMGLGAVCLLAGLLIGLIAAPVSGLLAVLLVWAVAVAGWELGLLLLAEAAWVHETPEVFVGLLLMNPAGAFRVASLVGLEAVPFDAAELETGRWVFGHIGLVAAGVFAAWIAGLFAAGVWRVNRQEF